ncbi:MAG: hypothetical protein EOM37_05075 [Proteobacteria bacterium]|nr:hypothetical protein [Pseudomonadota bacterium]
MTHPPRIAVLASYNASAFQKMMAIQDAQGCALFAPAVVICNNSRSGALDFAAAKGIPSAIINAARLSTGDSRSSGAIGHHVF